MSALRARYRASEPIERRGVGSRPRAGGLSRRDRSRSRRSRQIAGAWIKSAQLASFRCCRLHRRFGPQSQRPAKRISSGGIWSSAAHIRSLWRSTTLSISRSSLPVIAKLPCRVLAVCNAATCLTQVGEARRSQCIAHLDVSATGQTNQHGATRRKSITLHNSYEERRVFREPCPMPSV